MTTNTAQQADTYEFLKAQKDAILAKKEADENEWLKAAAEDITHYKQRAQNAEAECERLRAALKDDLASALLSDLVKALNNTTWSSWQATAKFNHELRDAEIWLSARDESIDAARGQAMKTSDFPSVREARLTVEKHMERYKKLMGIKKGKTMIELPPPKMTICSPDPDRGHWYDADQLRTYGDQRAAEAREQMREECIAAVKNGKDKSGINDDGRSWLERASRGDYINAIKELK